MRADPKNEASYMKELAEKKKAVTDYFKKVHSNFTRIDYSYYLKDDSEVKMLDNLIEIFFKILNQWESSDI